MRIALCEDHAIFLDQTLSTIFACAEVVRVLYFLDYYLSYNLALPDCCYDGSMDKTLHVLASKIWEMNYCTFDIFLHGVHKLADGCLVKLKFEDRSNNDMEFFLILDGHFDYSGNWAQC